MDKAKNLKLDFAVQFRVWNFKPETSKTFSTTTCAAG